MSRQSIKKCLGMSDCSKISNKLVIKDPLSCNQMSIFTPGNIKKKEKKKPYMTCNNISIWYKPCRWCWAKWIRRMECARICTSCSCLHRLKQFVWFCAATKVRHAIVSNCLRWEELGHLHAGWFAGARGFWSPRLHACSRLCEWWGGGTMIKKNTFPNVNRFILSLFCHPWMFLETSVLAWFNF